MITKKLLSTTVALVLGAGITVGVGSASATGTGSGPPKYLIAWLSDQYMDGKNVSPLDGILGLPAGTLPDADFLAVLDANPQSPTYGQVVNTAEMPAVYGAHLLSATENFVDNALGALGLPNHGVTNGDLTGGVPNFNPSNGLPPVVPAPSSVLNEAHHHSVVPTIFPTTGHIEVYYGGLISANVFGCDISDPMHIHPAPNTTLENIPLHTENGYLTNNVCGLMVNGATQNYVTGTDDLDWNAVSGHYYVSMMGAGANRGNFAGTPGIPLSLPPALSTPGGVMELDPFTATIVGFYGAVPQHSVPGHGTYVNGTPMLGPKRYAPRTAVFKGGVDGNGNCTGQPLCLPGVAPYDQLGHDTGAVDLPNGINQGPDTGLLAHPHGIGLRTDLVGTMGDGNGSVTGTTTGGILVTSDYADPLSLALTGSGYPGGAVDQDLGTTVRFWNLGNLAAGPYAVSQVPDGPRHEPAESMEEPEGLMAMRVTHNHGHKGMFVASMCGGALFYSPDITVMNPQFTEVYDFGGCTGASVFTLSLDDHFLYMPISGIKAKGDPTWNRDYPFENERRLAVLDISALLAADGNFKCRAAPALAWLNIGPENALGQHITLGPSIFPYLHKGDVNFGGRYWPNNAASDCPNQVQWVNLGGPGPDGIVGTADDHPNAETSRGGPHFVVHDDNERYIGVANYFVDLRKFAVADVDYLLTDLHLGHAWQDTQPWPNSYPPGGPLPGQFPKGGLGAAFQLLDDNNLLPQKTGGWASVLPGTGSVGDDSICMFMRDQYTGKLTLDTRFNKGDAKSPTGCNGMDFGDAGKLWPANGARNPNAGNGSPHGMSFYTVGSTHFYTMGEYGPGTNYNPPPVPVSEQND